MSYRLGLLVVRCGEADPSWRSREHRFVQKQRAPLLGVGAVGGRAAAEFDFAVEVFDQARGAERGEGFAVVAVEIFEDAGG